MFDFISGAVENVLDVGEVLINGELLTKSQVANLISAGVSLYAISEATGLAEDVIKELLED